MARPPVRPCPPYGRAEIESLLPHRAPSLLLDEVLEVGEHSLVARKRVGADEPFFAGHFPGRPVMPGVLIIEAMAQAGLLLYAHSFAMPQPMLLAKAKSRFYRSVLPGVELRLVATRIKFLESMGLGRAEAFVGGQKVADAELGFAAPNALELFK